MIIHAQILTSDFEFELKNFDTPLFHFIRLKGNSSNNF